LLGLGGLQTPKLGRPKLSHSLVPRTAVAASAAAAAAASTRRPWRFGRRVRQLSGRIQQSFEEFWSKVDRKYPMIVGHIEFFVGSLGLAISSIRWFRFGFVAVYLGFRLILYSLLLLPAFLHIAYRYFHDERIVRRIRFGPEPRNLLDIYCPAEANAAQQGKGPKVPVVIAVMGGAWVMGHRAWNTQLGLRLMDFGVLVCAVDYRNFPLGQVPDMVEDLSRAFGWVFANVEKFGGDPENIMLIGQSAGAHLSALLLLEHSLLEVREGSSSSAGSNESVAKDLSNSNVNDKVGAPSVSSSPAVRTPRPVFRDRWSGRKLKVFLGVSGPYDLVGLEPHLVSRGIYARILYALSVDGDLAGCSPARLLKTEEWKENAASAIRHLPPMHLFTGEKDKSVPSWSSVDFAAALRESGLKEVTLDVRAGMSHTFPVVEGPMAGTDPQVQLILPYLFGEERSRELLKANPGRRVWPQFLIDIASVIMPY